MRSFIFLIYTKFVKFSLYLPLKVHSVQTSRMSGARAATGQSIYCQSRASQPDCSATPGLLQAPHNRQWRPLLLQCIASALVCNEGSFWKLTTVKNESSMSPGTSYHLSYVSPRPETLRGSHHVNITYLRTWPKEVNEWVSEKMVFPQ